MTAHRFDLAAIGAGLVVSQAEAELRGAAARGAMVVTAPPGTGKTTFVPPLVAGLRSGHRTILTQPRRVAVRAAAHRIASLDGSRIGDAIGFTVRGERRVGPDTALEVMTPGVLLRMLLDDPALEGVGAVVLDEVHERSVDGDLLLGMLAEVRALREDLLVVAMSATLDAGAVATLLGRSAGGDPVPVVEIPAALHPLEVAFRPHPEARIDARGVAPAFLTHVADVAVTETTAAPRDTDALVFVPGAREVDEVVRRIRERTDTTGRNVEALPLHGRIPAAAQDRAVAGRGAGEPQRIVVSTSLAESSLTVPGVRLVIDAGLSREVRRDRGRDMSGLVTVSASRASVEQRAGRAARQGPGRAVRLFSETDFARMPAQTAPEIRSADLTDAALTVAAWGAPGAAGLALLTPPPAATMAVAVEVLRSLDLVDERGHITSLGTRIASLPVGVREARALLTGAELAAAGGAVAPVAEIVAAMSGDHRDPGSDAGALLRGLRSGRAPGADRWKRETRRLARLAADWVSQSASIGAGNPPATSAPVSPGTIIALARPDWIARRTGAGARTYLLASGTRAALPEGSSLQESDWIAVREVQRADGRIADGTGAVIRLAAHLDEDEARGLGAALIDTSRGATIADGRVRVREEKRLGAILLAASPARATPADTGPAFASHLRTHRLAALRWSEDAAQVRGRLATLHRELGDPWPAVDDAALLAALDAWLGPDLARLRPGSVLTQIDVARALRRLLPWPEAGRFDELAPARLAVPSGGTARIDYPVPGDEGVAAAAPPVVSVKLQELFGLAASPRIVDGRVAILFHLLSPARRPLAVTDDLASFWNGPYQEVRKEMRGRYPKHPWPEDPWAAVATARTKRRTGN